MSARNDFSNYNLKPGTRISDIYNVGLQKVPKSNQNDQVERKANPSLFNRYSLFYYPGSLGKSNAPINYFDDPNNTTTGSDLDKRRVDNPSVSVIVNSDLGGAAEFEWTDFLYAKNYGLFPNNYLLALRRFGTPVEDNIIHDFNVQNKDKDASESHKPSPDVGRLISWMDGEENKLEDILSFSYGLNWKELVAEVQTEDASKLGFGNVLPGKIIGAIDGDGSYANRKLIGEQASNFDPVSHYRNRVYGPIDVIDKMQIRNRGLNFNHDIKIKFEYQLNSIDGINPKVAMLDLLSNILMVTYNRGEFWGGELRFGGAGKLHRSLGNPALMYSGDFGGYLNSMFSDMFGQLGNLSGGQGLTLEGLGNMFKSIGGNIAASGMGSLLDKMGRPEVFARIALLTGEATGEWHLTVGNPLNPICMIGNLYLKDSNIQFYGPLSKDDFPSKIVVECQLGHARPRDKWDIENMFSGTNGRMYITPTDDVHKEYAFNVTKEDLNGKRDIGKSNNVKSPSDIPSQNLASLQGAGRNILNRFPNHTDSDVSKKLRWTT